MKLNLNTKEINFDKALFLKDHNSEADSFLDVIAETNVFAVFVDSFLEIRINESLEFFLSCIKKEKKTDKFFLARVKPTQKHFIEDDIVYKLPNGLSEDDQSLKYYSYPNWPRLQNDLYIKVDAPKSIYKTKFEFKPDEWCYDTSKLSIRDWSKYLIYTIHEIWFHIFCITISSYPDKQAAKLIDYAIFILNDLIKKKINPSNSVYSKLIRACGREALKGKVYQIFSSMPVNSKQNNTLYYNSYMNGFFDQESIPSYSTESKIKQAYTKKLSENSDLLYRTGNAMNSWTGLKKPVEINTNVINNIINSTIFFGYDYCYNCYLTKKIKKKLFLEEILGGFKRDKNIEKNFTTCNICYKKFEPSIYYTNDSVSDLNIVERTNLLSPNILMLSLDNMFKNYGEKCIFKENFATSTNSQFKDIFYNCLYYFNLLQIHYFPLLPVSTIYEKEIDTIIGDLDHIIKADEKKHTQPVYKVMAIRRIDSQDPNKKLKIENDILQNKPTSKESTTSAFEGFINSLINTQEDPNINEDTLLDVSLENEQNEEEKKIEDLIFNQIQNFNDENPIMGNPFDERLDIKNNIYEIRNIISKYTEDFNKIQSMKLEHLFFNIEKHKNNDKNSISGCANKEQSKII